ncbi:MAG: hypothetical protein U0136_01770 [Bdellovibrionota bacterium]
MEPFEQAPQEPSREERILRGCSAAVPAAILQQLLGMTPAVFSRARAKLGLNPTWKASRKLTSQFLAELPDLNLLPLTEDERREIRLLRMEWCARRSDEEEQERCDDLITRMSSTFPTVAIAAAIGHGTDWVLVRQRELGIELDRPRRRRLEHQFQTGPLPDLSMLPRDSRNAVKGVWKHAQRAKSLAVQQSLDRSELYRQKLLGELRRKREQIREREGAVGESLCSGKCGESWPRDKLFFPMNFRSPDGLAERCKYCIFCQRLEAKRNAEQKKRGARGRSTSALERQQMLPIVVHYTPLVPGSVLRRLLSISEGTLSRVRHLAGVEITSEQVRETFWRFYFRGVPTDLPHLTDDQCAKLYLLHKALRERTDRRFARDSENIRFLKLERDRVLKEWEQSARGGPCPEGRCRECGTSYPKTSDFFKSSGKYLDRLCKVCANHSQGLARLDRLRRRFG